MTAAVSLQSLVIARGAFRSVPLSFSLAPGEKVALLGANGCGKSSLLQTLAGLLPARSGAFTAPASRRLSQGPFSPLPEWTVQETLADALPAERLEDALAHWQLDTVAEARLGRLSLGFQQRVSLACATHAGAELVLLDEPGNGLDPLQSEALHRWLAQANEATVLLVSHQPERLPACVTRALLIDADGALLETTPDRLPAPWPRRSMQEASA